MLLSQSPFQKTFSQTFSYPPGKSQSMNKVAKLGEFIQNPNDRVGQFIPKSKRAEISKEIRAAHFNLGYDQDQHQSVSKGDFKAQSTDIPLARNDQGLKFQVQNRKSNIELSSSKTFYNQTVNNTFFNLRQSYTQDSQNGVLKRGLDEGIKLPKPEALKKDLQKEHFKFGSDQVKLQTTNMDLNGLQGTDKDAIILDNANERKRGKKVKQEMRQAHFNYGKDPVLNRGVGNKFGTEMRNVNNIFRSTENNNRFKSGSVLERNKQQNLLESSPMKIIQEYSSNLSPKNQISQNLKKSSFQIGFTSSQDYNSMNKLQQQTILYGGNGTPFYENTKKSQNFRQNQFSPFAQRGESKTATISINKRNVENFGSKTTPDSGLASIMKVHSQESIDEVNRIKNNLASSHFIIGDQKTTLREAQTVSKLSFPGGSLISDALQQSPIDKKNNEKLSNYLKKESFKIGQFNNHLLNQKNLVNFYTSVYKNTTNVDRIKQGKPAQKADCNANVASLNLGSYTDAEGKQKMSENQANFNSTQQFFASQDKQKMLQEREKLSNKIRSHNFELHYIPKNQIDEKQHFDSVQNTMNKNLLQSFNSNDFKIQRGSTQQLKEYLQKSHLTIGNPNIGSQNINDKKGQPQKQQELEIKPVQKKSGSQKPIHSMRTSSEIVFGTGKNNFVTNNKDFYSWIQPKMQV
eukprot:403370479